MDRATALAQKHRADLVLATDPDADRLGGMTPTGPDRAAPWRFINGNELAALLTHFKLDRLSKQGRLPHSPIVLRTLVTTSLVSRIARHFRTQLIETARPFIEAMVQEVTGVKVLSLHHDISTSTGEEIVLFTLAESPLFRQVK